MTTVADLEADIRRATECSFSVPETANGRPCLLVGPGADRPVMVAPQLGAAASGCFRPDYPTLFSPGDRVTVRTSDHGSNAYVYVVDASSTGRNRREMWWRKLG